MPLVHSRRWSLDRGTNTYGYSRSWARRSSVVEASLRRRDAGREYLRFPSDGGRTWTRLESSSSRSGGDTNFRAYGDFSVFGRRDRGYDDSLFRRDRACDAFDSRNVDRRYGSTWKDTVYPKTTISYRRDSPPGAGDSSYRKDSTYTKTSTSLTDTPLARDTSYTRDSACARTDISQPKRDRVEVYGARTSKRVRFSSDDSPGEVSQPVPQTSLDTGTRRIYTQKAHGKEETHYEYGQISSTDH